MRNKNKNKNLKLSYSHDSRLAQAYVPYQMYDEIFYPEEALERGTLFPDLYFPYQRKRY
ncbi:spore coat associated protein CotJA [Selenihalanaerobacter shriftii]|uniref:Spore coat associated protein JA (CotJA) n=1 Tax=Selenihalanaerobacter shriftii TaxID=142842 RepID=A0A1T4JK00_9FIRM|nr:spore coat associated protein CotJA [Selenihalanaerobacter shriftii]SJZ30495.1 Spore coat associated protein JA (CotJA) [Selenihalanaerobacter shriftii]